MAWAEVAPERCEQCGEPFGPGHTLVGRDPGSPGHRVYHCGECGHAMRLPADQIKLRRVRHRARNSTE